MRRRTRKTATGELGRALSSGVLTVFGPLGSGELSRREGVANMPKNVGRQMSCFACSSHHTCVLERETSIFSGGKNRFGGQRGGKKFRNF